MTSRRRFLKTTALSALSTAAAREAPAQEAKSGFVDAHAHIWTADTARYPADAARRAKVQRASFTATDLLTHAQPQRVDRVVLVQMSFYKYDNRYMLDMMEKHAGVFGGIAIVDDSQPRPFELMRLLAQSGVRGFRISAGKTQAAEWGDGMRTMWACAADEGLAMCLLTDPEALPAVREMCVEFPETPVVIDHFARVGRNGTINGTDLDNLCRLAEFKRVHVKTSAFYALGKKAAPYTDLGPMIRKVRDAYGAERLMWGSDCPFQVENGHTYADSIALIRDRLDFLSEDDKSWMLRKTAEKLFFA